MGRIKELMEDISAEAQYDENAKELLTQKPFLANILIRTVEEFKEIEPKVVEQMIEGEPSAGVIPVDPGFTNQELADGKSQILGMNIENKIRKEGVRYFDVLFYIKTKEGIAKVIVNIEAQKENPSDYDIEMRGIFYASRLISSQLEREFTGRDYNGIQKVYSIWICLNSKENTLNRIHLCNEMIIGETRWKDMYDVINVDIVRLKKTLDGDESHELHRLLGAMFLTTIPMVEKENIIEKEFGITMESKERELIGTMCNLGEGIKELALNEGESRNLIKLVVKKIQKNKSLYQIADELEETVDTFSPIYKAVLAEAPGYDIDKIYQRLMDLEE